MAISRYTLFTDRIRSLVSVFDSFARQVASGLGMVNGNTWKILRGSWTISDGKAVSNTPPSNYPLATLKFTDTDVAISVDAPDPGAGAAFWVTDSGNWYAATYEQQQVCGQCNNCIAWNSSNCNSFGCTGNYNPFFCSTWQCVNWFAPTYTCSPTGCNRNSGPLYLGCNQFSPGNCYSFKNTPPRGFCAARNPSFCTNPLFYQYCITPNWSCSISSPGNCQSASCLSGGGGNCNSFGCTGTFNTSTCSQFQGVPCNCVVNQKIKIFKSTAGVISSISESIFNSTIRSFKAIIQGNQITISAYDATGYNIANKIGSDVVVSIDSPVKSVDHGIIISSSPYGQGASSSIEAIQIDPT